MCKGNILIQYVLLLFYRNKNQCRNYLKYDMQNGDTLAIDDLIAKQYENLPYPEFSPLNISNEERHYKKDINTPANIFPMHTLERQEFSHFAVQFYCENAKFLQKQTCQLAKHKKW